MFTGSTELEVTNMNNAVGRPTKMTVTVVSKLEDAFRFGATVSEACYLSVISREMFYQHYRSDLDFSDKIERARSWLAITAKHNVATEIMNGNIKASVWLLEKNNSLPTVTIEEELPITELESWDDDDKKSLDAYIRTSIELGIVKDRSEYFPNDTETPQPTQELGNIPQNLLVSPSQ